MALEEAPKVAAEARSFAMWIANEMGLTAEDNYAGWLPTLELFYLFLWPTVTTTGKIIFQTSAVLEALYQWLGGKGTSLDGFNLEYVALGPVGVTYEAGTWLKDHW